MPERSPSVHISRSHLHSGPRCTSTHVPFVASRTGAVGLFCRRLFTRLGVFAQLQEENGGHKRERWGLYGGVRGGGWILFAFGTQNVQSMQIDKQWPFAVLLFSCNISVSARSQHKKAHVGPLRPRRAPTPARCVRRRFKSAPRKGPRPCAAANHMKDAASLQIAPLKGDFDV